MTHRITLIPGDGIGPEVTEAVVTVLERAGLHVEWEPHDSLLHFGDGRVSLLCSSCGHETPGWDVKGAARRGAVRPEPHVVHLPFASERRVA